MEIVNFFEKLAGRWFSQRTTHALSTQQSKAGKADLEVKFLAPDADEVKELCQQRSQQQSQSQSASNPLCGLLIQQSSTVEGDSKPKIATALLVPLSPQAGAGNSIYQGTLLRSGTTDTTTYTFEDEVLTIISDSKAAHSEERLWFINDNLRMRTGTTELANGLRLASFCSEIRMGVKPPQAD